MIDCATGPFKRGANPVWYFVDLVGIQCDDRCWLWVLENEIPYIPAPVYHEPDGVPWVNPIQFLANGTLPTDIYFDPNLVYRLEIRRNDGIAPPSQLDELIYPIENYQPGAGSGGSPGAVTTFPTENQITNPQFALISVSQPYTLTAVTNPDPIEVAPGWFLELVGTGNVTIEQIALNSSIPNPNNAPYALRIQLSGTWTFPAVLRQRFDQAGNLWANEFVSVSYTARIEGAPQTVTTRIDSSDGSQIAVITNDMLSNEFTEYNGVAALPDPNNLDIPPDAYIDFKFLLPTTSEIFLTSVQIIADNNDTIYQYEQTSIERQLDHTFNYFAPILEYKPIKSHLVGWEFGMNPAQIRAPTTPGPPRIWGPYNIGANASIYVWDQTIVFQNSDNGFTVQGSPFGGLRINAEVSNVRLALIQYLEAPKAQSILNDSISVNVACKKLLGNARRGVVGLYYTTDPLPDLNVRNSIVDTLNADGSVNMTNGSWNEVPRSNLGTPFFDIPITPNENFSDTTLTGWDLNGIADIQNATFFAIVVGIEEIQNGESIDFHSVSVCSGDVATRPAPQTANEVLQDCQRYYRKSYATDVYAGEAFQAGALIRAMNSTQVDVGSMSQGVTTSFNIEFDVPQFSGSPIVNLYTSSGLINTVVGISVGSTTASANLASSAWNLATSNKSLRYTVGSQTVFASQAATGAFSPVSAWISFQYVSDSRLGIV